MIDQRRWHEGSAVPYGNDLELDRADDEPSTGADTLELDPCDQGEQREYATVADDAIIEDARRRYAKASGSEVTAAPARDPDGKPGAWLLLQARGGAREHPQARPRHCRVGAAASCRKSSLGRLRCAR